MMTRTALDLATDRINDALPQTEVLLNRLAAAAGAADHHSVRKTLDDLRYLIAGLAEEARLLHRHLEATRLREDQLQRAARRGTGSAGRGPRTAPPLRHGRTTTDAHISEQHTRAGQNTSGTPLTWADPIDLHTLADQATAAWAALARRSAPRSRRQPRPT